MTPRLQDKVAVITGAARGQGRSHAVRLAQEGADIIAVDICDDVETVPYRGASPADLKETVAQVEALDRRIVAFEADVRDFEALQSGITDGVARLGRLDIVAANAGIAATGAGTLHLSEFEWRTMLDVNLTGVWNTVRAAVPHILEGGRGGSVILTSSAAGLKGYANVGHYVAAKHGVVGLMKSLAIELGPQSIRVNSVHPTQVNTEMIMNPTFFALFTGDAAATEADFAKVSQSLHMLPTPWVEAVDISNAVLFLASDESRYVTGMRLQVDAGTLLL
jgi:SDR family mycofactocin-dependent oxidoreductase